jgi:DNA-binding protein H-NS
MAKGEDVKIARLKEQIAHEQDKYRAAVCAAVEATLAEFGLSLLDLMVAKKTRTTAPLTAHEKRGRRSKLEAASAGKAHPLKGRKLNLKPKYRNPDTGQTWTGHARPPAWIAGKDYADFEIHKGAD